MPEPDRVAIVDLADDLQVRKQRIFKLLSRLSIRPEQRRDPARGNQYVATVSPAEATAIRAEIEKSTAPPAASDSAEPRRSLLYSDDIGFFYIIQLEPAHDPGRFKVGFTMDLDGRLQKHRCSAPFARYAESWPCRRTWERAAMDCVTKASEQLHTEVFRSPSLEGVVDEARRFFAVMPSLQDTASDPRDSNGLDVEGRHG